MGKLLKDLRKRQGDLEEKALVLCYWKQLVSFKSTCIFQLKFHYCSDFKKQVLQGTYLLVSNCSRGATLK